jgi:hypothetical protein
MRKIFISILSLLVFSCQNDNDTRLEEQVTQDFTIESVKVYEELTNYYPSFDLGIKITKDRNDDFYTLYSLKGLNGDLIHLKTPRNYAKPKKHNKSEGTTCSGGEDCARALYSCLNSGDSGVLTSGGCEGGAGYCVVCVQEYQ